jgi:hypothetical protein
MDNKLKNSLLISLVIAFSLCSSMIFAQSQEQNQNQNQEKSGNEADGEKHRSEMATFVQKLLDVADRENGNGIGEEVKAVAAEQDESKDKVADAINKIKNRNALKTFLIGTDYKNIGELRSDTVKTENQINQLKILLEKTATQENKTTLQAQIQTLEQEQQKIENFIKTNEDKFSLFGWFVKLFNK